MHRTVELGVLGLAALLAAAAPSLLAFNVSPSPTFLNQALAVVGWGVFAWLVALEPVGPADGRAGVGRAGAPVLGALALVAAAAVWSGTAGSLPSSLTLSALGLLAGAALMLLTGVSAARSPRAADLFAVFCFAWVLTGGLNAVIALIQVFAPDLPDGDWIARSSLPGRAVGNLRQPNHLNSLLLWALIGLVMLLDAGRARRWLAWATALLLVLAVVLTASRTGVVGVVLLAVWGLADRRLSRAARGLLLGTPLLYIACWLAMAGWAAAAASTFGGEQRLAEADLSASRFGIWSNTWTLIRAQPWTGVGFGEFNFAWSLTPFPGRPGAFFDHTHNLPLQLAVELGLPVALAVVGLLLWGLWAAWQRSRPAAPTVSSAGRCALAMLVLIGLHSLLEYPLWYSYFLLPAAWAWGFALGVPPASPQAAVEPPRRAPPALVLGAIALVLGGAFSVVDYWRVAAIFSSADTDRPLSQRIADGQRSVFFAHHAHYAAATVADEPATALPSFAQASHYLLDTRLMMAWARAYAAAGDTERARYLTDRLREFRNPASDEFLAACNAPPAASAPPFQCAPSASPHGWREFMR